MAAHPNFLLLFVCQSLSAVGEIFGQRYGRQIHERSNLRMLVSVSVYSALQAFVVLTVLEFALPTRWTDGQGAIWMWCVLERRHSGDTIWVLLLEASQRAG